MWSSKKLQSRESERPPVHVPAADLLFGRLGGPETELGLLTSSGAIYYLPEADEGSARGAEVAAGGTLPVLHPSRNDRPDEKPADADVPAASTTVSVPSVAARIEPDVQTEYAPPDPDLLARFGHGLSSEQADQLMQSEQALILEFSYSGRHVWNGLKEAQGLVADLATPPPAD